MRVLTVRQPWAWAIAMGHKTIENRTWATTYRGPLAIHSASRWDDGGEHTIRQVRDILRGLGASYPAKLADDLPYSGAGLVLAVVDLVGMCDGQPGCDCGPWAFPGHKHWKLTNARRLLVPPPARGRLGLWEFDVDGREAAA